MSLRKNMGTADRIIRTVLALVFIGLIVTQTVSGTVAIILGVLAAVFLVTSFVSFCPLYLPFRLSTRKE
ncbi:MAG: DUF2892 domain-containing protein [Chloroflexi bacterium]|nr:MAG: DUF2892 domain-containing protein [Chloroflexota bacterium]